VNPIACPKQDRAFSAPQEPVRGLCARHLVAMADGTVETEVAPLRHGKKQLEEATMPQSPVPRGRS